MFRGGQYKEISTAQSVGSSLISLKLLSREVLVARSTCPSSVEIRQRRSNLMPEKKYQSPCYGKKEKETSKKWSS